MRWRSIARPVRQLSRQWASGYQPMQSVHPGAMTDWKALGADKKITAGICAILVGWLGVHKFILGYTTEGVIQLVLGF